jgi:hypothetical protein
MSENLHNRERKHEQNNDCGRTAELQVLLKCVRNSHAVCTIYDEMTALFQVCLLNLQE